MLPEQYHVFRRRYQITLLKHPMSNYLNKPVIGLMILVFMNSCKNDIYVPGACYNQNIKSLVISNCAGSGCHNSKDYKRRLDLTSYSGLMKIVTPGHPLQSELYTVLKGNEHRMPPDHNLSDHEILLIRSWISLGASQNDCPMPTCDSVNVTYSKQVSSIIQNNCLGCHTSGSILLTNYNYVKTQAASGALLGSILQNGTYNPMPQGYKLSDCDIKTIQKWVNAGYPNN